MTALAKHVADFFALERREMLPAVLAAAYFFCILAGYFTLRPLRDAMGLEGGVDSLRVLFLVTLAVMVGANLVYGGIVSRVPRRVFVPAVYWFAILCLAAFVWARSNAGPNDTVLLGKVFYVWLSIFNLFAVSVFWGFMADLFTLEQGKRVFGFIAVGGTAGAICGSAWTGAFAESHGIAGLIAAAITCIAAAGVLATTLGSIASRRASRDTTQPAPHDAALGGASWQGIIDVLRSPYLAGIAAYVALFTILSTLLYFEKLRIVADFVQDSETRAAILARIELAGQSATIVIQLFITGRLMRRFGVGALLVVVPAVTVVGFVGLAAFPALITVAAFEAARRACNFALSKPARETLFTTVPRADKYKAKTLIDTFVYRGGDTAGTLADSAFALMGVAVAWLAAPLALAGVWLGLRLGKASERNHPARTPIPTTPRDPVFNTREATAGVVPASR